MRKDGLLAALRLLWGARAAVAQNWNIARTQSAGRYWVHRLGEFRAAFEEAGFLVRDSYVCYRSCSDVIVRDQAKCGAASYAMAHEHLTAL